jgi:NAD(P)H-hydrate epimerase
LCGLGALRAGAGLCTSLGVDDVGRLLGRELALRLEVPAVLDADALTAIAGDHGLLRSARAPRVLTPHPGEAGRLLGMTSAQVQADRYAAVERLARQSGCVVVLKGARTLIADGTGRVRVNPTGTPAMAVGGTGDVLSGIIGALLASLPAFEAAVVGVYLHGLAGELAALSDRGLLASELAAAVPRAIAHCRVIAHGEAT